jgi:hypothetical protein
MNLLFMIIAIIQSVGQINAPNSSYQFALCNAAEVYHLKSSAYLAVREKPNSKSPSIDKLHNGEVIYTCDESGEWIKIYYRSVGKPCLYGSLYGLDARNAGDCKSGWVNRKWINILSG